LQCVNEYPHKELYKNVSVCVCMCVCVCADQSWNNTDLPANPC